MSRPSRGAWIETSLTSRQTLTVVSRALRGARGLKHGLGYNDSQIDSRALRGARGLKLKPDGAIFDLYGSRPSRGAWIETPPEALPLSVVVGRALRGARGLKHTVETAVVSFYKSRPSRGAWIET